MMKLVNNISGKLINIESAKELKYEYDKTIDTTAIKLGEDFTLATFYGKVSEEACATLLELTWTFDDDQDKKISFYKQDRIYHSEMVASVVTMRWFLDAFVYLSNYKLDIKNNGVVQIISDTEEQVIVELVLQDDIDFTSIAIELRIYYDEQLADYPDNVDGSLDVDNELKELMHSLKFAKSDGYNQITIMTEP